LGPLHISGTVQAKNFKFGRDIDYKGHYRKKFKNWSMGIGERSPDVLLESWDPFHISGTVQARNMKFGTNIDQEGHKR